MRRHAFLVLGLVLAFPWAAGAQERMPHPEHGLEDFLFPPEIVMRHQRALGITDAQRERLAETIKQLQLKIVDLQWQLQEENQQLAELLEAPTVDTDAALRQIDRVLAVEREVKISHVRALIEIKNVLTAEQQERLNELMGRHREHGGMQGPGHLERPEPMEHQGPERRPTGR